MGGGRLIERRCGSLFTHAYQYSSLNSHLIERRCRVWTERRDGRVALDAADASVNEGGKRALGLHGASNGDNARQRHGLRKLRQEAECGHTSVS